MKRKLAISISILAVILICLSACVPEPPAAPTFTVTSTESTITFGLIEGGEYSINGGTDFQTNNVFTGVPAGKHVTTARIAAVGNTPASANAASKEVYVRAGLSSFAIDTVAGKKFGDPNFQLSVRGAGSGAVTYSLVTGPATISASGLVTITGVGTVTVKADAAQTDSSLAASAQTTFTVAKGTQAAGSVTEVTGKVVGDRFQLATTGFSVTTGTTYSLVSGNQYASVDASGAVTALAAGTITVKATNAGSATYEAAETATRTITIGKAAGSLAISAFPVLQINTPTAIVLTGVGTGAVTYTVTGNDADAATVANGIITFNRSATVTLTAIRAADANYEMATASVQVTASTAFRFKAFEGDIRLNDEIELQTEGGNGKGAVTLSIKAGYTGTATVLPNGKIRILAPSTFIVVATKAAEGSNPVQVIEQSFIAKRALQAAISVQSAPDAKYNTPFDLNVVGGTVTGAAITYEILKDANYNNAEINANGKIVPKSMSNFTVTVTKAGDSYYEDVTCQYTVTNIKRASVTLSITTTLVDPVYGSTYNLTGANAIVTVTGADINDIRFTVEDVIGTGVASVNQTTNVLTINKVGTFKIVASIPASTNYEASSIASGEINAVAATQNALTYTISSNDIAIGDTFTITVNGGSGTGALSIRDMSGSTTNFTVTSESNVFTLTAKAPGNFVIEISKAGDGNYKTATVVAPVVVTKERQAAITITAVGPFTFKASPNNVTFTVAAIQDGKALTGTISYEISENNAIAQVDNAGKVTIYGAGSFKVKVTRAGYTTVDPAHDYRNESAELTVVVNKANQTALSITNVPAADKLVYGSSFTPFTTGGSTNNPVRFSITESGVASVGTANLVSINGVGGFTLMATMAGDENFVDAIAILPLVALHADNTVDFDGASSFKYLDANHQITFKNNLSTGRIDFNIVNSSVSAGSLNMTSTGILQFNGVGSITINAVINADSKYAAKTLTRTYVVGKADQTGFGFTTYPLTAEFDSTITVVASGGNTNGIITYASDNVNKGVAVGLDTEGKFKILTGDGAALNITAVRPGNDFYNTAYASVAITLVNAGQSAPVVQIFNVTKNGLYNSVTGDNAIRYGDIFGVRVYGNDFMYASSELSVRQDGSQDKATLVLITDISNTAVTGTTVGIAGRFTTKGVGKVNVVITLAGDLRFQSYTLTYAVDVVANDGAFTLDEDEFDKTYGETLNITDAIANSSNREVVFELINSQDRKFVTLTNGGKGLLFVGASATDVTIRAKRVANGFYTEATQDITLTIGKANQSIKTTPNATSSIKIGDKFSMVLESDNSVYSVPMWSGLYPATIPAVPGGAAAIPAYVSGTPANIGYTDSSKVFEAKKVGTSIITFTVPGNDNLEELTYTVTLTVSLTDQAALKIKIDDKDTTLGTFANPITVKYDSITSIGDTKTLAGYLAISAAGGSGNGLVTYDIGQVKKADGAAADGIALNRLGWTDTVFMAGKTVFVARGDSLGMFQIKITKAGTTDYNESKPLIVYVQVVTGDAPKLTKPTQAVQAGYGSTLNKAFYEGKALFTSNQTIGYGDIITNVVTDPESIISGNKIVGVSSQNIYATVTITKSGTFKFPTAPAKEDAQKFYEDATSETFSIRAIKGTLTLKGEFEKQDNYYVGVPYRFTVTGNGGTGAITVTGAADTYTIAKVEGIANQFDITAKTATAKDAKPLTVNQAADANFNAGNTTVNNPLFEKNSYIDFMELTLKGSDGSEVTYSPTSFDPGSILTLRYGVTYTYTIVGREEFGTYTIASSEVATGAEAGAPAFIANDTQLALATLYYNKAGVTGSFTIEQVANSGFDAGNTYRFDYVVAQGPQTPVYLARNNQSLFAYLNPMYTPSLIFTSDADADATGNGTIAAFAKPINDTNIDSGRSGSFEIKMIDPDKVVSTYTTDLLSFNATDSYAIQFGQFNKPGTFIVRLTMPELVGYYDEYVYEYTVVVSKAAQGDFSTTLLHTTNIANGAYVYGGSTFNINALISQADPKTANALTFAVAEEYQHILQLNPNGTFRVIGAGLVDKDGNPIPAVITVTRPGDATYADKVFKLEIDTLMGSQTIAFSNSDATQTLVFKEFYTPAELLDLSLARGGILMTVSNVSKANIAYPNNTGAGNNLFLYGIGEFDVSFQAAEVKNATDGYYSASNTITKRFKVVAADQPAMTINNALIGTSLNVQYTLQVVQTATLANSPVIWTVQKKVGDVFVAATTAQATVTSSTVTILEAGIYKIIATRDGKILANPKYDSTEIYYNTATVSGEYTFA